LRDLVFPFGATHRPVRFNTRAEINEGDQLIDTDTLDVDSYHTLNGELAWVRGPLSLQGELAWTNLDQVTVGGTELYGTYVQASYFLTGEHRPYDPNFAVFRRVVPYENFWVVRAPRGTQAGWGAWEAACRWSYLSFSEVNGQRQSDITTGLNWYWNPHTRLMVNWVHAFAHDSPINGAQLDANGDVLAMRLQVDF
jgi:phosphate-selective porin OprO/OprP